MAEKKYNKINREDIEDDESGSGSSTGGQAGEIEFQDFLLPGHSQEVKLTREQERQLLSQHANLNSENVKKQKEIRDFYKALKINKQIKKGQGKGIGYGAGQGHGRNNKAHPLSRTVHFGTGAEAKVTSLPSEQIAETNDDKRQELDYRLENRLTMDSSPKLKPRGL